MSKHLVFGPQHEPVILTEEEARQWEAQTETRKAEPAPVCAECGRPLVDDERRERVNAEYRAEAVGMAEKAWKGDKFAAHWLRDAIVLLTTTE